MCTSAFALDGVNLKVWHLDKSILSEVDRQRALDGIILSEIMLIRSPVNQYYWTAKHGSNVYL